ncbi:amine oxidase [Phanerochaete sordida]|uniref:Amine oxidase n=1 Tax=Phanerochaete sordida TaxID=48140 RepID=A0A9P3FXF7_9APHY|nr:amine oxidase [Phanerochaete sordida]
MPGLSIFGENDVLAHHGKQLTKRFLLSHLKNNEPPKVTSAPLENYPVGILGAGASGLYTALILDDLGIPYKIIEARDRVGGRLFTHTFPDTTGAPYNYYDVGAMRFPEISPMSRLFHLFDYPPLNSSGIDLKKKLKRNHFYSVPEHAALLSYNGVTVKQNSIPAGDPFRSAAVIKDVDSQSYLLAGAEAIVDDVIRSFAEGLLSDIKNGTTTGWEFMMKYNHLSTRAYMSTDYRPSAKLRLPYGPLSNDVINWLETFDKSTGWYDRSLSETVLEAVAFGWSPTTGMIESTEPGTKWWLLDGGAYQIGDCMATYIRSSKPESIVLNKRVTSIGLDDDSDGKLATPAPVKVVTDGVDQHFFCHVISSIPLPVMRTIDLRKAKLHPMQSNALRQLTYGEAVKIGMQFRTAWWTMAFDKDRKPINIIGGQTYTDSPLRTIVYPSHGDVMDGKTTTLIASYCWTEDAEKLGALIGSCDQVLVDLVIRELSNIHNVTVDFLRNQLIDTFAWDWSRDPCTMGAFAFFGPGKFENAYQSLNTPAADGLLHFAGEAISVRHAWVEGALTSAWRAVYEIILTDPAFERYQGTFLEHWGMDAEWRDEKAFASDPVPLPNPETPHDPQTVSQDLPSPSSPLSLSSHASSMHETLDMRNFNFLRGNLLLGNIAAMHPELCK